MTINALNTQIEWIDDRQGIIHQAETLRAQEMRNLFGGLSRR